MSESNDPVVATILNYKKEAREARLNRLQRNKKNFDFYHMQQDYSHKKAGQSREFIPKQPMAVEQITSFVHQGLINLGDWFSVEPVHGNKNPLLNRDQARGLLRNYLEHADFFLHIQDAVKTSLLQSLMIAKVHGRMVEKPTYIAESKKSFLGSKLELKRRKNRVWQLQIDLVRHADYYPDPTGEGLYELQDIEMDLWQLKQMAKDNPDIYDMQAINDLADYEQKMEDARKERETGQNIAPKGYRKRVVITECWGTILDADGNVLQHNGVCAVANDQFLIRKPQPNPFWHGKSPFVAVPLVRVPHSVHHKALMDAPTALNQAINEIFNLKLDAGIMSVFGVRQIRESWIDNADEISNGIAPGMTLKVNSSCPPGMKVLETVSTGSLSQESDAAYQMTMSEFHESALTNDLRAGNFAPRAVKATEVIEASNSITSVFTGIAKTIEESYIEPILDRAFYTIMQNANDLDSEEMKSVLGEKVAMELAKLPPEKRFERTVNGHDFKVYGITQTLDKIKDFRKITSLMQTVAGNPTLAEEFSKKYDWAKLLEEIMRSLDINTEKIKLGEDDQVMTGLGGDQGPTPQGGPDIQSQIPEMAASTPEEDLSPIPQADFAASQGMALGG